MAAPANPGSALSPTDPAAEPAPASASAQVRAQARAELLARLNADGHWRGRLASSALSTATAVIALSVLDPERFRDRIDRGLDWLRRQQNRDGGWGDTDLSDSNLSTSLLVWSAFAAAGHPGDEVVRRVSGWVQDRAGTLEPGPLARAVADRYGKDRTFSVPILMACAIGGLLGPESQAWRRVLPLPFELAALPRSWFAAVRLPVVSYALPALIAIGQARFQQAPPSRWLPWHWWRRLARGRTRCLLAGLQPSSGGFLEATPLTSFVTMALVSAGDRDHPVVAPAAGFLEASQRDDGSWPIDSDLATWVSTLAVKALHTGTGPGLDARQAGLLRQWLLGQQYRQVHPFTGAAPGGWAWTDLPGGVPDADDTPGALLALRCLDDGGPETREAAAAGCRWLLDLQNRDGGVPTFCRGWGTLPFDRSSPDLTAHCLRAWLTWRDELEPGLRARIDRAVRRALVFLAGCQGNDGSWLPLWFGNQQVTGEGNPLYGTAMVLQALAHPGVLPVDGPEAAAWSARRRRARDWMLACQGGDGGWGGDARAPASIEETALAVTALAACWQGEAGAEAEARDRMAAAVRAGCAWLQRATGGGRRFPVAPIGFYFARLWYYEELYPLVWTVEAAHAAGAVDG